MIKHIDIQVDDDGNYIATVEYKNGDKQSFILDRGTNQIYQYLLPLENNIGIKVHRYQSISERPIKNAIKIKLNI